MNRIVLTGAVLSVLGHAAVAATPEKKPARKTPQPPVQEQVGSGAKVDDVVPNSAAASAGIQPGDVILAINNTPINSYHDINSLLAASAGHPLKITVDRGGTRIQLKATPHLAIEPTAQGTAEKHWLLGISHAELPPPQPSESVPSSMFGSK